MAGAFEAQTKAALALILISVPEIPTLSDVFLTTIRSMFRDLEILPVFFTQFGAGLVTQKNLQGANVKTCLMVSVEQRHNPRLCKLQRRYDATIFFKEFDPDDFAHGDHAPDPLDSVPGTILNVREIGLGGYHSDRGDQKSFESGLIEFATANCPPTKLTKEDRTTLKEALSAGRYEDLPYLIAAEVWLGPSSASTEKPVKPRQSVGRLWSQIIKESMIPFDPIERGSKLSHAYAALGEYVADFASPKLIRKRRKS